MKSSSSASGATSTETTRQRQGLHLLKFLCAAGVVCAHCPTPWVDSWTDVSHLLTPLFLMITGFFCCDEDGTPSPRRCLKMLKRSAIYVTVTTALYLLFMAIYSRITGENIIPGNILTIAFWHDWLRYGHNVNHTLWYLTALFWSLLLLYAVARFRLMPVLPLVFVYGLLLGLSRGKYFFLFHDEPLRWIVSASARTIGIPYIILGVWMRKTEHSRRFRRLFPIFAATAAAAAVAELSLIRTISPHPSAGYLYLTATLLDCTIFYIFLTYVRPQRDLRFLSLRARDIYLFQGMAIKGAAAAFPILLAGDNVNLMPAAVIAALLILSGCAGFLTQRIVRPGRRTNERKSKETINPELT